MGRPPKPPEDKAAARVTVWMTVAERESLEAEARAAGQSLSSYVLDLWRNRER